MTSKVTKVPPDGGYGWVVTFAYALNNVVVLPLIAGFALVFQEAFDDTGLTATQGTTIITLNHGIGMLLSFFGGPVLRRFGYRKVAIFGAILISGGLIMTAWSSNFWMFIFSYSIINSMGVASVMAAFSLAINSFFKEKRGRAIGVGMSITGLGAIYMPLVMSGLLYAFGWRYAVMTLAALCLHSLAAACLLRPAKWYLKYPTITEEEIPLKREHIELINGSATSKLTDSQPIIHTEESKINGIVPRSASTKSLSDNTGNVYDSKTETKDKCHEIESHDTLGSNMNNINEYDNKERGNEDVEKEDTKKGFMQKIINFFDLTLLSDPIFVNILIGLSVAACVETNFSLLLPIILKDMLKFETSSIGHVMAVIGFSDTLFRLISPFIGEWCHKPPRVMYIVGLILIVFTRTIMLFTTSYVGMLFVALAMGITKGVRTVYMNIVIPSYVPIERLAFASGIQMFVNGITIIGLGSILGRIREASGSYQVPIIVLNAFTLLTVLLWSAEFLYFRIKGQKNPQGDDITA
ncbi:hypothetical protein ACJJTC_017749 [Scirpophaga incertulas]